MSRFVLFLLAMLASTLACTSALADTPVPTTPVITLSAAATASVANDRMHAWLRAEAEHADPVRAAADVNTRMAKSLARAKAVAGDVRSALWMASAWTCASDRRWASSGRAAAARPQSLARSSG